MGAYFTELGVTLFRQGMGIRRGEPLHRLAEIGGNMGRRPGYVVVGAPFGFGDYLVADSKPQEVFGAYFEEDRGFLFPGPVFPEDRRKPPGGYDRIEGVLQHRKLIAYPQGQGAAASPFPQDYGNDRCLQGHKFHKVPGNGFPLAPFLGFDPAKGSGGVHKADHRPPEFFRLFGQPQGLTVPFGVGHGKIGFFKFLNVPAFILGDDRHRDIPQQGDSPQNSGIVPKVPVPVEFDKILKNKGNIVVN